MLKVTPIPIFSNNYVWVIHEPQGNEVLVVDPGDAQPVIDAIQKNQWSLAGVLITHSHLDHIGGITSLTEFKPVPVYGPECAEIPQVDNVVAEGDRLRFWDIDIDILHLPGHLPEHVGYVAHVGEKPHTETHIFSGDILFSGGCGRIFTGTHSELKSSLNKITRYPKDTYIYPTHEYTEANLQFAALIEPNNPLLHAYQTKVDTLRSQGNPSLPTQLATELDVNPFLRCHQQNMMEDLQKLLNQPINDENEAFKALRVWKDSL